MTDKQKVLIAEVGVSMEYFKIYLICRLTSITLLLFLHILTVLWRSTMRMFERGNSTKHTFSIALDGFPLLSFLVLDIPACMDDRLEHTLTFQISIE
ncbi:hypothetical protein I7I50_12064 [Histoplasma capsulatum G186AR]|uniref:Uncharacterized protein n=1 Tax=Ajellomyces capsulatus TaxID=5037 RepID=A0A8H8CS19_AJECA|nr:hypothetical protein I7I52_11624 [Histoplasma capsulatum]QSS70436.1 hypothetical protein I7I50_12064 [Histoplasma capsulatum G186AR]